MVICLREKLASLNLLGPDFLYSGCSASTIDRSSSQVSPGEVFCGDTIDCKSYHSPDSLKPIDYALEYPDAALVVYTASPTASVTTYARCISSYSISN